MLSLLGYRGRKAIVEAPIRAGVTKLTLSLEGYVLTNPGHEGLTRWSHVPDVIVTKHALLILYNDYEYYPIEAAAFKDAD